MHQINDICKNQFTNVNGFQCTLLTPHYSKDEKRWIYSTQMKSQKAPSAQIHHDGSDHWVMSFQSKSGKIYLLDSLYNNKISASVQIQLCKIYGKDKTSITVNIPLLHRQQEGSLACGVYAIGYIVEFCLNGFEELDKKCYKEERWNFHVDECRELIIDCLQTKKMSKFPYNVTSFEKEMPIQFETYKIELNCDVCDLPNFFDDMVGCDRCHKWFHQNCINNMYDGKQPTWLCEKCQHKRPRRVPNKD